MTLRFERSLKPWTQRRKQESSHALAARCDNPEDLPRRFPTSLPTDGNALTSENSIASRGIKSCNSAVDTAAACAMGDDIAGPSLLLARHDLAHREHLEHVHLHNHLHKRQAAATAVVTEIVATVSVVQQVEVDSNGITFATETLTTEDSPPATTEEAAAATTTIASPAIVTPAAAAAWTAVRGPQLDTSTASQSLLSTSLSIPTHFPSLIISTNSTSCKSTSH